MASTSLAGGRGGVDWAAVWAWSPAGVRFWAVYVALFLAVRAPFIFMGYGADTDTYRVALSALHLRATGEYLPSRLPGYPLHELLAALLIPGGAPLTNLATVLAALAGVVVFDRIIRTLDLPGRGWLLLALGFTPWLIVTSTATLDYHFALTAMLAAYLAAIRRRPLLAGALLGLAAGFRLTALAFALPLLVVQSPESRVQSPESPHDSRPDSEPREVAARLWTLDSGLWTALFLAATALVTALAYLPVLATYGTRLWNYADSRVSPDVVIGMVWQQALGAGGAVAAVVVLALNWRRLARFPALVRADRQVLCWTLTVLIYALLFLRLPVDVGYLVPVYPFAFLLVARALAPWALPAITAAALFCGVVDLDVRGVHNFSPALWAREVRPSWRVAGLFRDAHDRRRWRDYARRIPDAPVPEHAVVRALGAFPVVAVVNRDRLRYEVIERDLGAVSMISDNGALWDDTRDVVYLAVSEPRVLERFRERGYAIYRAEPVGPEWRAVRLVRE